MSKKNGLSSTDYFVVLTALYAVIATTMNIFCMKPIGYGSESVIMDGGLTVSWIVFLISNIIVEVWGERKARKTILIGTIISFIILSLGRLIVFLPSPTSYTEQSNAFSQVFSNGVRTIISSFTAFYIGNFINVKIIAKIKNKTNKDNGGKFFFRSVLSTLFGQLIDNAIFNILTFAPIGLSLFEMSWKSIVFAIVSGTIIETVIESFFVPFITIPVVKKLNKVIEKENDPS